MFTARPFAIALVAALVAGCAGLPVSTPAGSEPAATPPGSEPVGLVDEPKYSCGGPPGFAASVLDQPATAELGGHPSAEALREVLETELPGDLFPRSGYWLVGVGPARADYLARSEAVEWPFAYASFEIHGGVWTLTATGACLPNLVLDGLSLATWGFDPALPQPGGGATSFTAVVTEQTCTGGKAMGDRLLPPSVTYGPDAIIVVFSARLLVGGQDCPGNPSTRVVVKLREPVGNRRLLDGAYFPPADPNAPAF